MKIEVYDVPEVLDNMVGIVGIEKFVEVSRFYGGENVYIPLYKSLVRKARNREIARKFNGVNFRELALEYGISVTHVKRILEDER